MKRNIVGSLEKLDKALCDLFNESGQQFCIDHQETMQKLALAYDELRGVITDGEGAKELIGFKRFDTE